MLKKRIKISLLYLIWLFFLSLQLEIATIGIAYSQNANLSVPANLNTETLIFTPITQPCVCNTSNPSAEGKIFYNVSDDKFRYCDGTQWKVFGIDVTAGTRIVASWDSLGSVNKTTGGPCKGAGKDLCVNPAADYVCNGSADPNGGSGCQDTFAQVRTDLSGQPGVIYVMAGTYNFTNPSGIQLYSNQSLIGSGRGTVIRYTRDFGMGLVISGSGITVSGLTFDASDPNVVHDGEIYYGGVGLSNTVDSIIDNLRIYHTKNGIVTSSGSTYVNNVTISNCVIEDVSMTTMRLFNASHCTISNNFIIGSSAWSGLALVNSQYNTISRNFLATGGMARVIIDGSSYNNRVTHNIIQGSAMKPAIRLDSAILGCCGETGGPPNNTVIAYNVISGSGIDIPVGHGNTVVGNVILNAANNGTDVDGINNLISANVVKDSGNSDPTKSGISFGATDRNMLSANIVSDSAGTGYGIALNQGNDYLSGNIVADTGGYANRSIYEGSNHYGYFTDKVRWTLEPDGLQTALSPGSGAMLNSKSSYVGFVTASSYPIAGITIAGRVPGDILILTNRYTGTITIPSGGSSNITLSGGGSRVLGQRDTMSLIYNGTVWLEMGGSDNN